MDGSSACVLFKPFPCAARTNLGLARPPGATQNLEYNVPGGKLNRGMSVVDSVEILKGRPLTDEEYFKSAVLGWAVELVRSPPLISSSVDRMKLTFVGGSYKRSSSSRTT